MPGPLRIEQPGNVPFGIIRERDLEEESRIDRRPNAPSPTRPEDWSYYPEDSDPQAPNPAGEVVNITLVLGQGARAVLDN